MPINAERLRQGGEQRGIEKGIVKATLKFLEYRLGPVSFELQGK